MSEDKINYPSLIDNAMRSAVREVLLRVQKTGLPDKHHFYISYSTLHPQVKMSEQLRSKYPKEITIVLQHQFWDFKVEDTYFNVTLSFSGVPEKLVVPFAALTAFADPSVKFGLQFQQPESANNDMEMIEIKPKETLTKESSAKENHDSQEDEESGDKIISLDAFRKK